MTKRIDEELALLRQHYPDLEYQPDGQWVRIPGYEIRTAGWSPSPTEVAFQVPTAYPGTPPYGFYVPAGIRYNGDTPTNYKEPAPSGPPFEVSWGIFSWQPQQDHWRPTASVTAGVNLLTWVRGFAKRFSDGL